jgi:zinc/manganese transport system substrate-binding protein
MPRLLPGRAGGEDIQSATSFRGLLLGALVLVACSILPLSACASSDYSAGLRSGSITVVAGENFWGSIASQIGGSHVSVTSIVRDPNADPHEYQASVATARLFASAQYVILNGAGYDTWAQQLLQANPVSGRKVMTVADLLGKHEGDNPHFCIILSM